MVTPIKFIYPKLRAKTAALVGGPKSQIRAVQTNGAPKCMMPYGNQAKISSAVL